MFILFITFALVVLWGIKINFKDKDYFKNYISKDKSTSIKGIFILIVFFSHFNKYAVYTNFLDLTYFKIIGLIGQIMVVPFLFYSGYGVMESIKKKGAGYVNTIPKNRILKVFLQFSFAAVLVLAVRYTIGEELGLKKIILTFLCWNRDWFILAIIFLYIFTYLSFKLIKRENYLLNVIVVFLLTVAYIAIISHFKSRYWYDTALCYPLGMLYSLYKDKIEEMTAERFYKWIISLIVLGIGSVALKVLGGNAIIPVLVGFIFTGVFIVILTMRVSFHNKVLNWCGTHLFEIYLLHHIPMMILNKIGFIKFSAPVSFIISLVITIGLSYLYSKIYKRIWALVSNPTNK